MSVQLENSTLAALLRREGLDTLDGAFAFRDGQDMPKPGLGSRSRARLELLDDAGQSHTVFLKRYGCEPLRRRWKQWLDIGRCTSRARVEFQNIQHVRQAGVPTMAALAMGEDVGLLGERRSYLIVDAVPGEALSRCGDAFFERIAGDAGAMHEFTCKLANLAGALHSAGLVHRDFYAAHIFLHEHDATFDLSLIDLARVFRPRRRRFRWIVKDLAGLKYSMPQAWVTPCWDRFLCEYLPQLGSTQRGMGGWTRCINAKVRVMQRRAERKVRKHTP